MESSRDSGRAQKIAPWRGAAPERPLYVSAFSGLGGLDLGLEAAGFQTVGAIEIDAVARRSLFENRESWRQLEPGRIESLAYQLRPRHLGLQRGQLALLAGGPPCQPFSKAAQWSPYGVGGLADGRGSCIWSFLELARRLLPAALLIENVPQFVRGDRSALERLEVRLNEINRASHTSYRLSSRLLNAVDFGVPQRRVRAILVAFRDGREFNWPKSTHTQRPVRAWDAIGNSRPACPPTMRGAFATLLPAIPEGQNYQYLTEHGDGPSLFGYRTRYWSFLLKLAKAEPAWTLAAHPGPSTGPFHWENRPLAVEELLQLQSFPACWRVAGTYREQVRQVGNATPPLLAEIIGRAIYAELFRKRSPERPRLHMVRRREVPAPSVPRSVPRPFLERVGEHPAHPGTGRGPGAVRRREGEARSAP